MYKAVLIFSEERVQLNYRYVYSHRCSESSYCSNIAYRVETQLHQPSKGKQHLVASPTVGSKPRRTDTLSVAKQLQKEEEKEKEKE
jgi:hypothetical protein